MQSTYEHLCEATADELFDSANAGLPAYTLPEEDALVRIVVAAGLDAADARAEFCRTVGSTLHLDTNDRSPLRWHIEASKRHLCVASPLDTPPSLPLLVVLTLAAESMHADSSMAANNFYGRVHPLLGVPAEREQLFIGAYRKHADLLWRSLNAWLEAWEGERGVPTAYSLGGMRYIGLPMSQAVVRHHDRVGLVEVFEQEALPAGVRMSPDDMELAIEPYVNVQPSPLSRNIRSLWQNPDSRARIVQAACLELESWTGATQGQIGSTAYRPARLTAYLRTFLRTTIDINLAIPSVRDRARCAIFRSSHGQVTLPVVGNSPGSVRIADMNAVSPGSLVGEVVSGWLEDDKKAAFNRRPRRVVPLRWDELQGCYIEVERVSVGEDSLIFVVAAAEAKVRQLLSTCARPGWIDLQNVPGMPTGWTLFAKVQIVTAPPSAPHVDLLPLVPRSRTSLTMRGGFDLPGRLRKWSSAQPPEVIAYAAGASTIEIRVMNPDETSPAVELASCKSTGELAILPLADYHLADGEYTASMFVDNENRPRSSAVIRLRSADTPLYRVEQADMHLVYSPAGGALWPLSAGPARWNDYVNGARLVGNPTASAIARPIVNFVPRERISRVDAPRTKIHIGDAYASDSCMVTGMHRFDLPPALPGRPPSATIEGECKTCGLVKRFAATPWAAARRRRTAEWSRPAVELPPPVSSAAIDQSVLFDAMCHVGQGAYRDLERIAGHVEGSGLYADSFLRIQEVLGHIDVSRDEWLQVSGWAVNAPTIIPIRNGRWVLVGAHSRTMLRTLRGYFGPDAVVAHNDRGAFRVTIQCSTDDLYSRLADLNSLGVEVRQTSPALAIARALPPLSQIEKGLTRIAIPNFISLERWNTRSAIWSPEHSISTVGAYRLRDFRSRYVIRSPRDLDAGTVGVGTAQLVKHIANRWSADPLVGYHESTGSVVAPLGADLPALYGRALSLCSGVVPVEHEKSHLVQYPEVPRTVADVVFDRLTK